MLLGILLWDGCLQAEIAAARGMDEEEKAGDEEEDVASSASSDFGLAIPKRRVSGKSAASGAMKPAPKVKGKLGAATSPVKARPGPDGGNCASVASVSPKGSKVASPLDALRKASQQVKLVDVAGIWKGTVKDGELSSRLKKLDIATASVETALAELSADDPGAGQAAMLVQEAKQQSKSLSDLSSLLSQLRGSKQKVCHLLEKESFADELTTALRSSSTDIDSLSNIVSGLARKVLAEAGVARAACHQIISYIVDIVVSSSYQSVRTTVLTYRIIE